MSEITDAFSELLSAQLEALGTQQTVTIGGTEVSAVVEAIPLDSVFIDGGTSQKQAFKLMVIASELSDTEPPKYTDVTFSPVGGGADVSISVLSCENNNGVFHILIGDPNSNA